MIDDCFDDGSEREIEVMDVADYSPSLAREVDIRYFLKDGLKYRDARVHSVRDYDAMRELLASTFPAKFVLSGQLQRNPMLNPTNLTDMKDESLRVCFRNVYDSYAKKK